MTYLKPCPFCRNDGRNYALNICGSPTRHAGWNFTVECTGCGAEGAYASSKEKAVTAWNTRALDLDAFGAARIRELEQGVAVKPLEWECIGRTWKAAAPFFGSFRVEHYGDEKWKALWSVPGYCDTFVEGDFVTANEAKNAIQNRIRSALTPAPVTVRDDAKTALAHLDAVEDAYTRWMLAHAVGDADLIHKDSNALSKALFTMFNSDPNDGPSEVTRALSTLAGQGGE